jgi:hypothetical protein
MSWSFVVKFLHHPWNSSISLVSKPEFCEEVLILVLLFFGCPRKNFKRNCSSFDFGRALTVLLMGGFEVPGFIFNLLLWMLRDHKPIIPLVTFLTL